MSYSIKQLREAISLNDIYNLLTFLDAVPIEKENKIICKTICHNGAGEGHHKLYFLGEDGTGIFHCFSGCFPDTFDVVELIQKTQQLDTNDAVNWLVDFFHLSNQLDEVNSSTLSEDWKIFQQWEEIDNYKAPSLEPISLDEYDIHYLKNYPWAAPDMLDRNISPKAIRHMGIKYDPVGGCVLFPNIDDKGRIVGVRRRALREYDEQANGKYRPWSHNGITYSFPSSFNLYTDKRFYDTIGKIRKAIVFESEKSVLLYMSYYGTKNNISCALLGSNVSRYQMEMLYRHGAKEIVFCFDRDYMETRTDDPKFAAYIRKLKRVYEQYGAYYNISFGIDRDNVLGYKDSPIDCGKNNFEHIIKDRRVLTDGDFSILS